MQMGSFVNPIVSPLEVYFYSSYVFILLSFKDMYTHTRVY